MTRAFQSIPFQNPKEGGLSVTEERMENLVYNIGRKITSPNRPILTPLCICDSESRREVCRRVGLEKSRAGQRVTVTKVALESTIEGSISSHSYSTHCTVLREAKTNTKS